MPWQPWLFAIFLNAKAQSYHCGVQSYSHGMQSYYCGMRFILVVCDLSLLAQNLPFAVSDLPIAIYVHITKQLDKSNFYIFFQIRLAQLNTIQVWSDRAGFHLNFSAGGGGVLLKTLKIQGLLVYW
jgi:hypothetical protein